MAIKYNLDNRLHALNALLGEYLTWFSAVVAASSHGNEMPKAPESLNKWLLTVSVDEFNIDGHYSEQRGALKAHHDEMVAAAVRASSAEGFMAFSDLFNSFMADLRAFSQTVVLEEWGLDVLTGLKNTTILDSDLKIEMERLSREGHPFCLGLVRIDDFEKIDRDKEAGKQVIRNVGGHIMESLRSYDDAYRIKRNYFILCLKQSDIVGGQKGLERFRNIMEDAKETYMDGEEERLLSVSSCVASPLPGDDIQELIDNLYQDLHRDAKEHGEVVMHKEISPLERFVLKGSETTQQD